MLAIAIGLEVGIEWGFQYHEHLEIGFWCLVLIVGVWEGVARGWGADGWYLLVLA